MIESRSPRNAKKLLIHCTRALLLLLASLPSFAQQLKKNGIAIWELPTAKLDAMLSPVPDAARLARLRQLFTDFGCSGDSLREFAIDKKGHRHYLVCTLAGQSTQPILITARYLNYGTYGATTGGWPDALMLPVLYNALIAEPRHFTFVFAEFDGPDGAAHFFHSLRAANAPPPIALVELNGLGFSDPHFFTMPPALLPAKSRPTAQIVLDTAWNIAQLQGFGDDPGWQTLSQIYFPNGGTAPRAVSGEPKDVPRVVLYSTYGTTASVDAFQKDHDFAGFFLGALDTRLNSPSPSSQQTSAQH